MPLDPTALAKELSLLCKRRGVLRPDLLRCLGPETQRWCRIEVSDGSEVARTKLADAVHQQLADDDPKVLLTVQAALALHPEAELELLRHRRAWLADQLGCAPRTVQRRVNRAFDLLITRVTQASAQSSPRIPPSSATTGTHLKWVDALLRLDGSYPVLTEHRSVVFTADGISEIVSTFGLPKVDEAADVRPELLVEVIYGGRLRCCEPISDVTFRLVVELARAFQANDTHRYGLVFKPGQPMRPHYTVQPRTICERLDLAVRFNPSALPDRVWRLDGTLLRVVDDAAPSLETVEVDRLGEVRLTFHDLQPGMVYGAKWSP